MGYSYDLKHDLLRHEVVKAIKQSLLNSELSDVY